MPSSEFAVVRRWVCALWVAGVVVVGVVAWLLWCRPCPEPTRKDPPPPPSPRVVRFLTPKNPPPVVKFIQDPQPSVPAQDAPGIPLVDDELPAYGILGTGAERVKVWIDLSGDEKEGSGDFVSERDLQTTFVEYVVTYHEVSSGGTAPPEPVVDEVFSTRASTMDPWQTVYAQTGP